MKISFSPYQLKYLSRVGLREGALLKVEFERGIIGYADCHPWPEVGDLPLKEQMDAIKNGMDTRLINCAFENAKLDADARLHGLSLLDKIKIPLSHFLGFNVLDWTNDCSDRIISEGFTHVKFKIGKQLDKEIEQLLNIFRFSVLKLRLDFNYALNFEEFEYFLRRIERLKEKVDFIEDPFPYQKTQWTKIQAKGWKLACDRDVREATGHVEAASYLIIKPAMILRDECKQWSINQTKIVTSYAAHPLEQMAAAYVAAELDSEGSQMHGLLSHRIFESTLFSKHLSWHGPNFQAAKGTGWGFDAELTNLEWVVLREEI